MQSVCDNFSRPVCAVKILRATHLGMCFGVRDAIAMAFEHAAEKPLTILGELVHNETVLAELRQRGIQIEQQISEVSTPDVMITAHGASEKRIRSAQEQGLRVVEATCPLVAYAHGVIQKLARENYHPVIIGKRDHVEVRGLTEDLEQFDIVLNEEDVNKLAEHPRFGVASQTTQPVEKVRYLVELIRSRFPGSEVRFVDTVCKPTKQRRSAAVELARNSDVVVVIGGAHSNNTRELVGTCAQFCSHVHHVRDSSDLLLEWFAGAKTVGITAGTSTPDAVIDDVEEWLVRNLSTEQTSRVPKPKDIGILTKLFPDRFDKPRKTFRL